MESLIKTASSEYFMMRCLEPIPWSCFDAANKNRLVVFLVSHAFEKIENVLNCFNDRKHLQSKKIFQTVAVYYVIGSDSWCF